MTRRIVLLSAIAAAVCGLAFSSGLTTAFFIDRDTDDSMMYAAGYLEVSVDADFSGYGVPGDTLKLGSVRITNTGTLDMTYELRLTADAGTAELLDFNNGSIILSDGAIPAKTTLILDHTDGGITLLYYGELPLDAPEQVFDVTLAFKGVTLVDGNDYQNRAFSIAHEVTAYQIDTDAFDRVNLYAGGGE